MTPKEQMKLAVESMKSKPICHEPSIFSLDTDELAIYTAAVEAKERDRYDEVINKLRDWIDAYPLSVFPEPDFKKAARVLKDNGITLDAISASNMRHVLAGVNKIINVL
jgi:hypothetical protein